jgi:hypothetical protein
LPADRRRFLPAIVLQVLPVVWLAFEFGPQLKLRVECREQKQNKGQNNERNRN